MLGRGKGERETMSGALPDHARAVVIGGGIAGLSVVYHLTRLGWGEVVLIERGKLTCGTTWHSAGNVVRLTGMPALSRLFALGARLYPGLEAETGQATGWRQCGRVMVARGAERMAEFRRLASIERALGQEAELLTPAEVGELWPLMRTDDLAGGIWSPGDGRVDPSGLAMAYAKGARSRGARILEQTRVTGIEVKAGAVTGVVTERGKLSSEVVVNCAGLWAPEIGRMCGVNVPLYATEHFYMLTRPIDGVSAALPTFRDPDASIYGREEVGGLLVGCFEPKARPLGLADLPPDFSFSLLAEDWDHFEPFLRRAIERIPALEGAQARMLLNGPESFTPDGLDLMGEAPEVAGFYLLAGLNSAGVTVSGGAGLALAEWIVEGRPTMDVWPFDIRRFSPFHGDEAWLARRVTEVPGAHFRAGGPGTGFTSGRPARCTPLHGHLEELGAVFGEADGWERPLWFAAAAQAPAESDPQRLVSAEHRAAREAVALFERSSLAKLTLRGAAATGALARLCTAPVELAPGQAAEGLLLNDRAGIEAEVRVIRLAPNHYLIVSSSSQAERIYHWLRRGLGPEAGAALKDLTTELALLAVVGPNGHALLAEASGDDLSDGHRPLDTVTEIELGGAAVRALRVAGYGAPAWELYVPAAQASAVFAALTAAGSRHGLRLAGHRALEALRLEAGRPAWGAELWPDITPLEAGLMGRVRATASPLFVGAEALERERTREPSRRLVRLSLERLEARLLGDEPVYRDGAVAGFVTSVAFGAVAGETLAFALLTNLTGAGPYEIEVEGERLPARLRDASTCKWGL